MKLVSKGTIYYWSIKRFSLNLLVLILAILSTLFLFYNVKAAPIKSYFFVTVHRGDTLWSIAQKADPNEDPRKTIQLIKEQNNLLDSNLVAGQKIKVIH